MHNTSTFSYLFITTVSIVTDTHFLCSPQPLVPSYMPLLHDTSLLQLLFFFYLSCDTMIYLLQFGHQLLCLMNDALHFSYRHGWNKHVNSMGGGTVKNENSGFRVVWLHGWPGLSVHLAHQLCPDWITCTTIGWIAMKIRSNVHGVQRVNPTVLLNDPVTLPLVPPIGQNLQLCSEYLTLFTTDFSVPEMTGYY